LIIGSASTFARDHTGTYRLLGGANLAEEVAFKRCGYPTNYISAAATFRFSSLLVSYE
jgi:hypothetical protein